LVSTDAGLRGTKGESGHKNYSKCQGSSTREINFVNSRDNSTEMYYVFIRKAIGENYVRVRCSLNGL
jgi:hypothetical protein